MNWSAMPAVSVIMPAYNAERYLPAAIESVLRQTLADLELLVIDDGSSDGTPALARGYAARDHRVRTLTQPSAGPGPARNLGLRHATTPLIAFLDSDDEWAETFLEEQVKVLRERPDIDVVFGNARFRGGPRHGQPCRPLRGEGVPITLAELIANEESPFIMTVCRREAIEAAGGFDPATFTNEEYDMWIRAALAGSSFTRHTRPLGWYRVRENSLSANELRMIDGILKVLARTRPLLDPSAPERALLDRRVRHFRAELAAASVRASMKSGNSREAARHLAELCAHRGGRLLAAAASLARRFPDAALFALRVRQSLRRWRGALRGRRSINAESTTR